MRIIASYPAKGLLFVVACCSLWSCDNSSSEYLQAGRQKLDEGDYPAAVNYFEQSIEKSATPEGYNLLGVALYQQGEFEASLEHFSKAIETYGDVDYRPFYNRGNSLLQLKRYAEAIRDYNNALRSAPEVADIYLNRGNCKYFTKNFDEAISDYGKAIQIDNANFLSHFNLGKALVASGKFEDAKPSLIESINLNSGYPPSHYWLGVCEIETGHREEGCLQFKTAERLGDVNAKKAVAELCSD